MRFSGLESLKTVYTGDGEPSYCDRPNVRYLLHLEGRTVPHAGTEASGKLKGMAYPHSILTLDLTINDASGKAVDMCEDDGFVNGILSLVLDELIIDWEVYTTQFRLQN